MPKLIAENLKVYKINSKPLDNSSLSSSSSFIMGHGNNPVYIISRESVNPQISSTSEKILEIDKLFYSEKNNAKRVAIGLPEDFVYSVSILSDREIRESIKKELGNITNPTPRALKEYARKIEELSRRKRAIKFDKADSILLSQLNVEGWVLPSQILLEFGDDRHKHKWYYISPWKALEKNGFIEAQQIRKSPYGLETFMRLTPKGESVKRDIVEQTKKFLESRELPEGAFPSIFELGHKSKLAFREEYIRLTA